MGKTALERCSDPGVSTRKPCRAERKRKGNVRSDPLEYLSMD